MISAAAAVPTDGTNAFPNGQWNLQTTVDLNNPAFFPHDGIRHIVATPEASRRGKTGSENRTSAA